jgi:enoyl-CoA hydratase/3-hydroxyacyl-CoA dehydrogenase
VDVKTVTVLGAGTMGHGIAHAAMTAGYDTVLFDISEAAVD